ncbi:MAG: hypothetical protein HDS39_00590 [Bacteroides sp.]|nr:hypothetical protein [Bacteroides sp.]
MRLPAVARGGGWKPPFHGCAGVQEVTKSRHTRTECAIYGRCGLMRSQLRVPQTEMEALFLSALSHSATQRDNSAEWIS